MSDAASPNSRFSWVGRAVIGIVVATFLSDVGHEMVTSVLPLYLGTLGLGASALGMIEGAADVCFSLSKLAGGAVGHRTAHKRQWATAGYGLTSVFTAAMGLVSSAAGLLLFRTLAWFGRGFRSPMRDAILAENVASTHFGRAYGIERTSDMLGAVAGPALAAALLAFGVDLRTVILVSIVPSALSAVSFFALTGEKGEKKARPAGGPVRLPARFWMLLGGVFLFGLGDFSRSFLILLAARSTGAEPGARTAFALSAGLYLLHNAVSAAAAYPAGHIGDRRSKLGVLVFGYGLGAVTNLLLATAPIGMATLAAAVVLSGVYIAIEETLEKAVAAEMLDASHRSLGFGVLACANSVGDLVSSLYVGFTLDHGGPRWAFGVPAVAGLLGTLWLLVTKRRLEARP